MRAKQNLPWDVTPTWRRAGAGELTIAHGVAVCPGGLLVEEVVAGVEIHYTTSFQNHDLQGDQTARLVSASQTNVIGEYRSDS